MMTELESDPRLTAYVLDELEPAEREEFERELENRGANLDDLADEIKEVARMLEQLYAEEPEYRMTERQRRVVLGAGESDGDVGKHVTRVWPLVGLGLAACLIAGAFVWVNQGGSDFSSAEEAPPAVAASPGREMEFAGHPEKQLEATPVILGEANQGPMLKAGGATDQVALLAKIENAESDKEMPADFKSFALVARSEGALDYNSADEYLYTPLPDGGFFDPDSTAAELYDKLPENRFMDVLEERNQLSTFSVDVDTASYANVRRFLNSGQLPPKGAVRIEEMVNYFRYDYPQPEGEHPFSASLEVAECPWKKGHRLFRIGLKGLEIEAEERPAANLVFLIDASGSMNSSDKLGLLKTSMIKLTQTLREQDRISIVAYAGRSGLVLSPTSGAQKETIIGTLGNLRSAGGTNGGEGIQMAYRLAKENFVPGGVNRVILATDGDFNVGITDQDDLVKMVADRAADDAIFLTILGFGRGNLKDSTMEKIANRGNGNYFYLDSPREGEKVLVEEVGATLVTIAKDVKAQIEFNPAKVESYRLIGYENRMLKARDFNDDGKDAGEVGAGHTVTALYEIVPVGAGGIDPLKYGAAKAARKKNKSPELLTLKLRYKAPEGKKSKLFELPVVDAGNGWEDSSGEFRFAAAVAGYGMLLRDSEFKGDLNYELVKELAAEGIGKDPKGRREEFLGLVDKASKIKP